MRSDNLKRHRKICRGGKGMHMKIPPRIVTPAQKSKDLRGMHTAVRPVRRLATKDPKWNELIKKLNEAEDEHPPKQELKRIQDNGKLTSAPLQSEDEEMISEDEDWDSGTNLHQEHRSTSSGV